MLQRTRSRSRSPIQSPIQRQLPLFPLMLMIPSNIKQQITPFVQQQIYQESKITRLHYAEDLQIENNNEGIIYLYDESTERKLDALRLLLKYFATRDNEWSKISLRILIPEIMKAMIIGQHGRQISAIQDNSRTLISIMDKIKGLNERRIEIKGKPNDIVQAVADLYSVLVEQKPPAQVEEDQLCSMIFVIPSSCSGCLIGKRGMYTKRLRHEFNVDLKITASKEQPCRENDDLASLTGEFDDCKKAIPVILDKMLDALDSSAYSADPIKLIIPAKHTRNVLNLQRLQRKDTRSAKVSELACKNNQSIIGISGRSKYQCKAILKIFEEINNRKEDKIQRRQSFSSRKQSKSEEKEFKRHKDSDTFNSDRQRQSSREDKLQVYMAIRNAYVPLVIGKRGETIKEVSKQTGCEIMFSDRPNIEARTPERSEAKLCKLQGTPISISNSVKLILEKLAKATD